MATLDELNQRFAIAKWAQFEPGENGLICLNVTAPAARGQVYLHGAHVTHFQPAGGQPVLFLSGRSAFEPGKAIRGGVPVIFPWFGRRAGDDLHMHGIVRTRLWSVEDICTVGDGVRATFGFDSSAETRAIWPNDFALRFTVTISQTLTMELAVRNTSPRAFSFEEALHTYLAVGDVRTISIDGLGATAYVEKFRGPQRQTQAEAILKLTGPTDRVYLDTAAACIVDDPGQRRRIAVSKDGSRSTVVWNPWSDNLANFADLDPAQWSRFVCVETCNVWDHAITLEPGAEHTMRAILSVEAV